MATLKTQDITLNKSIGNYSMVLTTTSIPRLPTQSLAQAAGARDHARPGSFKNATWTLGALVVVTQASVAWFSKAWALTGLDEIMSQRPCAGYRIFVFVVAEVFAEGWILLVFWNTLRVLDVVE